MENKIPHLVKTSRFEVKASENVYRMKSNPRGVCLIINNMNFEDKRLPARRGSQHDADRLKNIFEQLQFEVISECDLNTKEMKKAIQDLAKHKLNKQSDAVVLIILTHGDDGHICGTDHDPDSLNKSYISYEYVVEELNNYNCKDLRNKPKICFFQACNGDKQSIAVEDNVGLLPSRKVEKVPEASDMILSFAAQEGFTTARYESCGGVYAYHLANVLMEYAWKCDLLEMLAIVERRVRSTDVTARRRVMKDDGEIQIINEDVELCLSTSVKQLGWSKKLYFNPVDKNTNPEEIDAPTIEEIVKWMDIARRSNNQGQIRDVRDKGSLPSVLATTTGTRLWILGGDEPPELLSDDGKRWTSVNNTGLTNDHQAVANSSSDQVYVFNEESNVYVWKWKENALLPLVRLNPSRCLFAHAVLDGKLYIMGGQVGGKVGNSCQVYDTKTGNCNALNEMTRYCAGRNAVVLKGKIYVTPGRPDQELNKLDVFDPVQGQWTQAKGYMNSSRCRHAIAACDKYIWVFGGCYSGGCIRDVERYSPTRCLWEKMALMPTARSDLSVSYFQGKFYAIGGNAAPSQGRMNTVEIYDLETNVWSRGPSLLNPRAFHSSIKL